MFRINSGVSNTSTGNGRTYIAELRYPVAANLSSTQELYFAFGAFSSASGATTLGNVSITMDMRV